MLKPRDHVIVDGGPQTGIVKDVHPHEVSVDIDGETHHFALESLRRDPTMREASDFRDH